MGTGPSRVTIVEVGPRDGLQNIPESLDIETRVRFIDALSDAGLPVIEVGAFVSRKAVPQMAATGDVVRRIRQKPGTRYVALVPNLHGLEEALAAGLQEVALFTAASDTFNRENIRATTAEAFARFEPVAEKARAHGVRLRGYVSCAFACPYEGTVPIARVLDVTERFFDLGVAEVSLGDTIGVATPNQVEALAEAVRRRWPPENVAFHFHDTHGTALANTYAAWRLGFHIFDAAAGGLGGCPFAPGAAGNLATEDLIYLFHGLGVETGVRLEGVVAASRLLEEALGRPLPSRTLRACLAPGGKPS